MSPIETTIGFFSAGAQRGALDPPRGAALAAAAVDAEDDRRRPSCSWPRRRKARSIVAEPIDRAPGEDHAALLAADQAGGVDDRDLLLRLDPGLLARDARVVAAADDARPRRETVLLLVVGLDAGQAAAAGVSTCVPVGEAVDEPERERLATGRASPRGKTRASSVPGREPPLALDRLDADAG